MLIIAKESYTNLITWVYDGDSYTPVAKLTEEDSYTIVQDYLGTLIKVGIIGSQGFKFPGGLLQFNVNNSNVINIETRNITRKAKCKQ